MVVKEYFCRRRAHEKPLLKALLLSHGVKDEGYAKMINGFNGSTETRPVRSGFPSGVTIANQVLQEAGVRHSRFFLASPCDVLHETTRKLGNANVRLRLVLPQKMQKANKVQKAVPVQNWQLINKLQHFGIRSVISVFMNALFPILLRQEDAPIERRTKREPFIKHSSSSSFTLFGMTRDSCQEY